MKVELLNHTPLHVAADAIRKCWDSGHKSDTEEMQVCQECSSIDCNCGGNLAWKTMCGPEDKALIERVGNKFKHASTLEHLVYTFDIDGVSRALLQELARHRIASLSVKSTRYTLKELKDEKTFTKDLTISDWIAATSSQMERIYADPGVKRAEKYLVFTQEPYVDASSIQALENLRILLVGRHPHQHGSISNDRAKYSLPEAYKTSLAWTINARSLQNFLALRTSKSALWEIRDLANAIYEALPEDHKYLFKDSLYDEDKNHCHNE